MPRFVKLWSMFLHDGTNKVFLSFTRDMYFFLPKVHEKRISIVFMFYSVVGIMIWRGEPSGDSWYWRDVPNHGREEHLQHMF